MEDTMPIYTRCCLFICLFFAAIAAVASAQNHVFSLDGDGDYVEIINNEGLNAINSQVTMEAWIKVTAFPNSYIPLIYKGDKRTSDACKNRSYALWLNSSGFIELASAPSGQEQMHINSTRDLIVQNQWYHIAGVIDAKQRRMALYLNGIEVAYRDFGKNIHTSMLPLRIGSSHEEEHSLHGTFAGEIDEVRIWNIARTEKEIAATMHISLSGKEPGLVGYWQSEGEGETVIDATGNGHHGQFIGDVVRATSELPTRVVKVVVTDAGGNPLSDATVFVEQEGNIAVGKTNSSGRYHFSAYPTSEEYKIYATHGKLGDWQSISLRQGESQTLSLVLKPATPALIAALIQIFNDENEGLRQRAVWALKHIGIPETMAEVYALREKTEGLFVLGIFIAIGTVHLLLFLFYPKSVNNLYYAIWIGNIALFIVLVVVFFPIPDGSLPQRVMAIIALGIGLSGLRFLYALFYTRLPKPFWVFLASWMYLAVGVWFIPQPNALYGLTQLLLWAIPLALFLLVACVEMLRVLLMAIIRKRDGAWVIGTGFMAMILVFIAMGVNSLTVNSTRLRFLDEAVLQVVVTLALIGLLISVSTYLARDFARTSKTLEAKNAQLATANQQIHTLNEQLTDENLRMGAELEITKRIQRMILPTTEELRAIADLDIAADMQSADDVGGDYYDVLQQEGMVAISIGDVTGHGLESGLVMLMTQTAVQALLQSGETDPVHLLDTLNRTIYNNVQRIKTDKNLTLCLLDCQSGEVKLSGQHEEMIVVRRDGTVELVDTIDLGFPIGLDDDIAEFIDQTTVQLQPGDGVVLYTDGITEAENTDDEQYGLERLCEVVSQHWAQAAEAIKEAVIADVRGHIGEQEVYDDITLLVLKQK